MEVALKAQNTYLKVEGTVDTIKTEAPKTEIKVTGTISNFEATKSAEGSTVNVDSLAVINNFKTGASKLKVSGNGKVENAIINGNDTVINTIGTKLEEVPVTSLPKISIPLNLSPISILTHLEY
jgi:hypothetical protein